MQIHIARACGSCVDMRIWMFLMGSIMLQMAWAVWRSLYSQALHICWKHEEHEEHQQCWFKCRYNEHWERAQRTDTYFGMSVNAIVLRQTFILWSFVHGRLLWFALVLLLFFCFLFIFRLYPTSSSGSFFIRNKLVARFSIPMNRHYITRPQRRQDRRKISIFQKKGNVLFECLRLNKTFRCAMNARTWNKYYTLLMPRAECEIHCGNIVAIHTSDFTHQHATIYLFAFNGFPVLPFAAFWFLFQFNF